MLKLQKAMPLALGGVIALVLAFVPEAKPLACGIGFALPSIAMGD